VVLDLGVAGGDGLESIDTLLAAHHAVPIVALTGDIDAALAVETIQRGAQDCLSRSGLGNGAIGRAVSYAIARAGILAAVGHNDSQRSVIESVGEGVIVQTAG
jgi:FixJ family two-component response regulator